MTKNIFPVIVISFVLALHTGSFPQPRYPAPSPNELGKIMILEYHQIDAREDRWTRSVQNFKHDLERLYERGYVVINLNDYIDGKIDVPAGKTPCILTFDDSSPGQFRYLQKEGKLELDPECAIGVLEGFHRRHPDFGLKATFFVLPGANQPHKLFGQPEYEKKKLQYLVERGFEIGNHTLWHANLRKFEYQIEKQLALSVKLIQETVPNYRVRSLALPFGIYPQNLSSAIGGEYDGIKYHNEAILQVSGGPALSPYHKSCDLFHLPRIQAVSQELKYWFRYFDEHPNERFVSDGKLQTISFPRKEEKFFNAAKFRQYKIANY